MPRARGNAPLTPDGPDRSRAHGRHYSFRQSNYLVSVVGLILISGYPQRPASKEESYVITASKKIGQR